tara:strand:- start:81 stop:1274 length:1194 start_codon:yes stop_codon:yes gene_type:complete
MNVLLKEKNGSLKDKLSSINHNIDLLKNKMDQQSKYIRDIAALTTENKKKYEKQIKTAEDKIKKLQEHNNKLSAELTETGDVDLTELQDRKNSSIAFRAEQRQELKAIAQRGLFLEKNDECPTCEQPIQNKDGLIFQTKNEAYRIESTLRMVESDYKLIEEEIKSLQETIAAVNEKTNIINSNNREISSLNQSNDDLRSYLEEEVSTDLNDAREELEKITNEKEDLLEEKLKVTEQFNYNGVIAEMLRDTGIKTKIIKQYLPAINKLVNQHLQVLDFFVSFDLDESFQETIRSRYRDDFTYDSFSEGEKQRIDLSLLFTWRQIAKMKNSVATNLLMLDETFDSSLDHDGVENLLKILHTLGEDTNTFIISHKGDILDGKFESKIEFTKERNFSKMKI